MKIKKFKELNEADTNQIPGTQLHKYLQYYRMWCNEEGIEIDSNVTEEEIIKKGKKYAEKHNLPNMFYYRD